MSLRTKSAAVALSLCPLLPAQEHDAPVDLPRAAPVPGAEAAAAVQTGFAAIAAKVWPSVVTLRAFVREPKAAPVDAAASSPAPAAAPAGWIAGPLATDYPGFRRAGVASGFVVAAAGEILTCNHALRGPDGALPDLLEIETHDGARILGEVVGAEPTVNLAIVQAVVFPNGHAGTLVPLPFGDNEALVPGHWTFGFGDPDGPERFFAIGGFVAQPNRDCYQDLLSSFYMQVGMVAHPEAYGGPLVDVSGHVVGILAPRQPSLGVWQASSRLGVEFGLPSKIVAGLYDTIRQARSMQSPWFGFAVMSRPELARERGLPAFQALPKPRTGILIENVFAPSPAAAAGIRPGDWLVTFGSTRIFTPVDFQRCLYTTGIGGAAKLELWRDGETVWHELTVERRPAAATPR
jgi:serine protease Do